jgi:hypothetical protein
MHLEIPLDTTHPSHFLALRRSGEAFPNTWLYDWRFEAERPEILYGMSGKKIFPERTGSA